MKKILLVLLLTLLVFSGCTPKTEEPVATPEPTAETVEETPAPAEDVIYDEAGEYSITTDQDVYINVSGVTLTDSVVNGDLIIDEAVGEGEVLLNNVEVNGQMIVRGGGQNTVELAGTTTIKLVIIEKADTPVRLLAGEDVVVTEIIIEEDTAQLILEGEGLFELVNFLKGSRLDIREDTVVIEIIVEAANAIINNEGKITTITFEVAAEFAELLSNYYDGSIDFIYAFAKGISIRNYGATLTTGEGVFGTIANGEGIDEDVVILLKRKTVYKAMPTPTPTPTATPAPVTPKLELYSGQKKEAIEANPSGGAFFILYNKNYKFDIDNLNPENFYIDNEYIGITNAIWLTDHKILFTVGPERKIGVVEAPDNTGFGTFVEADDKVSIPVSFDDLTLVVGKDLIKNYSKDCKVDYEDLEHGEVQISPAVVFEKGEEPGTIKFKDMAPSGDPLYYFNPMMGGPKANPDEIGVMKFEEVPEDGIMSIDEIIEAGILLFTYIPDDGDEFMAWPQIFGDIPNFIELEVDVTTTTAELEWYHVEDAYGEDSGVKEYRILQGNKVIATVSPDTAPASNGQENPDYDGSLSKHSYYLVDELSKDTDYVFRVMAVYEDMYGYVSYEYSDVEVVTTLEEDPSVSFDVYLNKGLPPFDLKTNESIEDSLGGQIIVFIDGGEFVSTELTDYSNIHFEGLPPFISVIGNPVIEYAELTTYDEDFLQIVLKNDVIFDYDEDIDITIVIDAVAIDGVENEVRLNTKLIAIVEPDPTPGPTSSPLPTPTASSLPTLTASPVIE